MARQSAHDRVSGLLAEHGRTFADEAGISLRDEPQPLYRLLVLALLSSTRIASRIAVAASRELSADGLTSPQAVAHATWQDIVRALGRAHYVRYDESTATALQKGARMLRDRWDGDLRKLRDEADRKPDRIRALLQEHPRIGPVGADIFCREAQAVWPELRPAFDARALSEAERLGLPHTARGLAETVPESELARLAAALVRSSLAGRSSGGSGGSRESHTDTDAEPSFQELYAQAKDRHVPGRSRMNKRELARALGRSD
jgi:hypothetical protein